jgi:hypothetical protein
VQTESVLVFIMYDTPGERSDVGNGRGCPLSAKLANYSQLLLCRRFFAISLTKLEAKRAPTEPPGKSRPAEALYLGEWCRIRRIGG